MREKGTISNMKRFLKFFLTVAMALVMLLGDAGTLKLVGVSAESVPGAAFTVFSSGGMSGSAGKGRNFPGRGGQNQDPRG